MADHLFGLIVEKKKQAIPLESVSVTGHVKGYVLGLETVLSYKNTSDDPLEVVFRFPIDEDTAVVGLEAHIGGRTIRGVVQEKETARATYDDAIASGLSAALGEEKSGDVFSLSLGNLPPKQQANIILKLAQVLPLEDESIRFSLPTVLKPRYTPSGSVDPLAPLTSDDTGMTGTAPSVNKFQLYINSKDCNVTSPTHDIVTSITNDQQMLVSLKELTPLVKDLVILITSKDPHVPKATVEIGTTDASNELMSSPVVMFDFFPSFKSVKAACEFVFVVDRSGSMSGRYINSAKETLILFLKSIPPGCYFNIIGFGSNYEHLFPKSVPYNQSNLDKAMSHATGLSANLGGTELLNPLRFIFSQPLLAGLPRQVFVLTDGSVSNTNDCIDETKRNATVARVFTFGIGSGASTALVKGLAKAGNGSAEFIKEGDRMQSKVISSLKKALQPSVTDVNLTFTLPRGVSVVQSPSKIPPIFNGEKLVLYGILKGPVGSAGSATLTGSMLGKPIKHKLEFKIAPGASPSAVSTAVIHQLAAKSLIKTWEDDKGKKKDIIRISIESGVVSKYTSYVAVDEDNDKPIDGAIKVWDLTATSSSGDVDLFSFGGSYQSLSAHNVPLGSMSFNSMNYPPPPSGGMMMNAFPPPLPRSRGMMMSYGAPPLSYGAPPPPAPMMVDSLSSFRGGGSNVLRNARLSDNLMDQLMDDSFEENSSWASDEDLSCELSDIMSATTTPTVKNTVSNSKSSAAAVSKPVGGGLSQLIALQSAEGYWSLNESFASAIGQSLSNLKAPSECSNTNIWATLLALVVLEVNYGSQHDEWELVALKAELWLDQYPSISALKVKARATLKA